MFTHRSLQNTSDFILEKYWHIFRLNYSWIFSNYDTQILCLTGDTVKRVLRNKYINCASIQLFTDFCISVTCLAGTSYSRWTRRQLLDNVISQIKKLFPQSVCQILLQCDDNWGNWELFFNPHFSFLVLLCGLRPLCRDKETIHYQKRFAFFGCLIQTNPSLQRVTTK